MWIGSMQKPCHCIQGLEQLRGSWTQSCMDPQGQQCHPCPQGSGAGPLETESLGSDEGYPGAVGGHLQHLPCSPWCLMLSWVLLTPLPRNSVFLLCETNAQLSRARTDRFFWPLPSLPEPFLSVLLSFFTPPLLHQPRYLRQYVCLFSSGFTISQRQGNY